jgi:hypothetical protein
MVLDRLTILSITPPQRLRRHCKVIRSERVGYGLGSRGATLGL